MGRRIRKATDPLPALARSVGMPEAQVRRHDYRAVDVANRSEGDQRHSVRSKETQTVRKLTRVEMLCRRRAIEPHQAAACQWYADAHSLGYDTIGCTANYAGAGGGSFGTSDLIARYKAQAEAREDYLGARAAIPPMFLPMFEAVVLEGKPMNGGGLYERLSRSQRADKLRAAFRYCANTLHTRIAPLLPA